MKVAQYEVQGNDAKRDPALRTGRLSSGPLPRKLSGLAGLIFYNSDLCDRDRDLLC